MELKEAGRVLTSKPIPSRPTNSGFRFFSELLVGAVNASMSPANACSDAAVTAIRPKTIRVKPTLKYTSLSLNSQSEASGVAACSFDDASNLGNQSNTFKPLAKVVSWCTVPEINSDVVHLHEQGQLDACAEDLNQNMPHLMTDPPQVERSQSVEVVKPPKITQQMLGQEPKMMAPSSGNVDRSSYDGYNWRKYGQKQVKGSEYPRSYYKCTYPNCAVKKMVERSFDGQIIEIVYKGEHNHPKPQSSKRSSSGVEGQGKIIDETCQDHDGSEGPKFLESVCARHECHEGKMGNKNPRRVTSYSTPIISSSHCQDPSYNEKHNACGGTCENSVELGFSHEDRCKGLEGDDEEEPPRGKRRKNGDRNNETTIGKGLQKPRILMQNHTEPEIMGDGFHWRKYGQKVVKGNPYPRSYYRCTNLKCNVRKHVERNLDDPKAFITTYEGKHNHEMPDENANNLAERNSEALTARVKQ